MVGPRTDPEILEKRNSLLLLGIEQRIVQLIALLLYCPRSTGLK
jgi:hypothetical protein